MSPEPPGRPFGPSPALCQHLASAGLPALCPLQSAAQLRSRLLAQLGASEVPWGAASPRCLVLCWPEPAAATGPADSPRLWDYQQSCHEHLCAGLCGNTGVLFSRAALWVTRWGVFTLLKAVPLCAGGQGPASPAGRSASSSHSTLSDAFSCFDFSISLRHVPMFHVISILTSLGVIGARRLFA